MPKRLNLGSKFLKEDLLAMTHINGEFYYATDTNELFFCDDDELKLINAGGDGGGGDMADFVKWDDMADFVVWGDMADFVYGPQAPFRLDLSELERTGDEFTLDISRFNGKHIIITNNFPLAPETPGNKFQFKLTNVLGMDQLYNPVEFNLSVGAINGGDGFYFRLSGATSFIIYKGYSNGTEVQTPLTEYVSTQDGLLNIKVWGDTAFITKTESISN